MTWEVRQGDCVEEMALMPECSVDAVVTDPPYGLEFMGKEWDRLGATSGSLSRQKLPLPHFRDRNTGQPAQDFHECWATEALRILRPGGHLLAFGGTRTVHRLACAIEDAGFEIRDRILTIRGGDAAESLGAEVDWLYGSG